MIFLGSFCYFCKNGDVVVFSFLQPAVVVALAGGKEYIHTSSGLNTEERKCAGWNITCGLVTRLKTNFVLMVKILICYVNPGHDDDCLQY